MVLVSFTQGGSKTKRVGVSLDGARTLQGAACRRKGKWREVDGPVPAGQSLVRTPDFS